jgi:kumamolisin
MAKVEAFAKEHGLKVVEASAARRTLVLSGTAAQLSTAFGVKLARYEHPEGTYRGRSGPIYVPSKLSSIVQAVLGLDDRPQAKPHLRAFKKRQGGVSYTPPQLARLYDFPKGVDGSGQCIGIVELGGGYTSQDLKAYFASLSIPMPKVIAVGVDGGSNSPTGDPSGPDGEVMLDVEVAGGVAPGAQIVVYFAPNTDRGFLDAITTAVHDSQNKPSVISISWGSAESNWTSQATQAFDQAFQAAAVMGVTVCCAAGDGGSSDGESDGLAHVDFPASSPHALACGGTRLMSKGGVIASEVVWNDEPGGGATGGGVSDVFPLPAWQSSANVPPSANPGGHVGRGVPDICADADPVTGYDVRVDGQTTVFGGTSAVAPLWAGLIALMNQQLGRPIGYLNPLLYGKVNNIGGLHDITMGNNGAYSARPGWDACTGLGSPDGSKLLTSLGSKKLVSVAAA